MVNYKKLLIVFGGFHDNIRYGYLMYTFSEKNTPGSYFSKKKIITLSVITECLIILAG